MSYGFYSFLHIFSVITALVSLAAILGHILQGGDKSSLRYRKQLSALHGISLLVAFVSGFGLMARTGYNFSTSQWLYIKILAWLTVGMFPVILYRRWLSSWNALIALIFVIGLAVFAVTQKPF